MGFPRQGSRFLQISGVSRAPLSALSDGPTWEQDDETVSFHWYPPCKTSVRISLPTIKSFHIISERRGSPRPIRARAAGMHVQVTVSIATRMPPLSHSDATHSLFRNVRARPTPDQVVEIAWFSAGIPRSSTFTNVSGIGKRGVSFSPLHSIRCMFYLIYIQCTQSAIRNGIEAAASFSDQGKPLKAANVSQSRP